MARRKKLFILSIVTVSLFALALLVGTILGLSNVLKTFLAYLVFTLILVVLAIVSLFFINRLIVEINMQKDSIKENEYNLHRTYRFYNYDGFARALNRVASILRRHNGYLLAFTPIKTKNTSSYPFAQVAEFSGCIADYLKGRFEKRDRTNITKNCYYCYYRGTFLIYAATDESGLNTLIKDIENAIYDIAKEKDFRLYVQPSFGICENLIGSDQSVFEMTNKAITARDIAENNFETALFFREDMLDTKTNDELEEIVQALDNGEFVVYYQPKYNLSAKRFVSSEALVRWNSPTRGLLSPMKFINTAENGGLIHRIDMYVFEQVCKDLAETKRRGRRLIPVSVNFSLYEFYGSNFVDDLISVIEKYSISPSLVEIEVTEGTTGVNLFLSISILKKIKEYGIRVLMDDFGVGYSNFNNLRNLPVDVVKIDKSFIDNIEEDLKAREIVKFMIEFSKEIGLEVVAEGVDNVKQVELLKKFKCDTIQGFFYSPALAKAEYERFLSSNPFEKKGVVL